MPNLAPFYFPVWTRFELYYTVNSSTTSLLWYIPTIGPRHPVFKPHSSKSLPTDPLIGPISPRLPQISKFSP